MAQSGAAPLNVPLSDPTPSAGPPQPKLVRNEYNIDNHRNIIPLNAGFPAFKSSFVANSNGKFQGVIVDQTTLDTSNDLDYRDSTTTTEGEWFSGDLEYTDAIPRQFYLVLIAQEPTTVLVENSVEPRIAKPKLPPQIPSTPAPIPEVATKPSKNRWLVIGIVIIVTVVIAGLLMTMGKTGDGVVGGGIPNLDDLLASL